MKKRGYSGANGSSSSSSSGGSGSATSEYAWANMGLYLKPTQGGFDGFFSVSKFPEEDTPVVYTKIVGWEVRYSTNMGDFATAWAAASTYDSSGALDGTATTDIGQNYWHWTPSLSNGTYRQLVKICFMDSTNTHYWIWNFWTGSVALSTFSAPSVSYDNNTNTFDITGGETGSRRVVEFKRKDAYTPYSTYLTSEETDICYNCTVRNQEFGIYSGQVAQVDIFNIWADGSYKVKLVYDGSHPAGTKTRFSTAVNDWITEMNTAISGSGVSFSRDDSASSPDVLVTTKSNSAMGSTSYIDPTSGHPVGYTYGGLWDTSVNSNGYIYHADISINYQTEFYDTYWTSVEAIITEELTQAMGCGGDLTTRSDCINSDFNWYGKSDGSFDTITSHIQTFLYKSGITAYVGSGAEELAVAMNPSNGACFTTEDFYDFEFLTVGEAYYYRVWEAKSDNSYSIVPAYSSFATIAEYGGIMVWNGTAWGKKPIKRWNGTTWETVRIKRYNGSIWEGV